MAKRFLSIRQAADRLGVDQSTIYRRRYCRRLSPSIFLEVDPRTVLVKSSKMDQLETELRLKDRVAA